MSGDMTKIFKVKNFRNVSGDSSKFSNLKKKIIKNVRDLMF